MARDSWNRESDDFSISDIAEGMASPVNKVMETRAPELETRLDALNQAFKTVSDRLDQTAAEQIQSAKQYADSVIAQLKTLREHRSDSTADKLPLKYASRTLKYLKEIRDMGAKPHTFWVGLGRIHSSALRDIVKAVRGQPVGTVTSGGTVMADDDNPVALTQQIQKAVSKGVAEAMGSSPTTSVGEASNFDASTKSLNVILMGLAAIAGLMSKAWDVDLSQTFSGALADSNDLRENLRSIVFMTRGYGDANRAIEQGYFDITQGVMASGESRAKYQDMWVKNLQRGFSIDLKDQRLGKTQDKMMKDRIKGQMSVQTSAIHAAKQLGMGTDSINQLFMDWRMHLGYSALDMQRMSLSMEDIARSTGVTGQELEKSMQSASVIVKQLQKAGVSSVTLNKHVIAAMTVGEKYGIGDKMAEIQSALTDLDGFMQANQQTKMLLLRSAHAAQYAKLPGSEKLLHRTQRGIAQSPQDRLNLMKGQEIFSKDFIKQQFGPFSEKIKSLGFDLDNIDLSNVNEMTTAMMESGDEGMGSIVTYTNKYLKEFVGLQFGTAQGFSKSLIEMEEASKPFGERINKMTSDLKKMSDEGYGETAKANELRKTLLQTESAGLIEAFGSIQKTGGVITESVKKNLEGSLGSTMSQDFAKDKGGKANQLFSAMSKRALGIGNNLKQMALDRGMSMEKLKSGLIGGDKDANLVMGEILQEISRKEREGQDPITDIRATVKDTNTHLGDMMTRVLLFMPDWMVTSVFWLSKIAGYAVSTYLLLKAGQLIGGLGKGGLKGLFGKGGLLGKGGSLIGGGIGKLIGKLTGRGAGAVAARVPQQFAARAAISSGTRVAAGVGARTAVGVGARTAVGVGARAAGAAGLGALGVGTGGIALAITAALGGVIGAFRAGAQAAQIFGVETEKLTMSQKWAAEGAGALTGIFDFMTFGLFGKWIGPTGQLTVALAKFFDKFPVFSAILQGILMPFKMTWGVIKGIWNLITGVASGIWEAVKAIWAPIYAAYTEIQKAMEPVWEAIKPLTEAFGFFKKEGSAAFDVVNVIAGTLGAIGKFVGMVIHGLGIALGWLIKVALMPTVFVIKNIVAPIFTFLAKRVVGAVNTIYGMFKWLYDVLIGHSIIPDLVFGIIKFFMMLPIRIMGALGRLALKIPGLIFSVLLKIPGIVFNTLESIGTWMWNTFTTGLANFGTWMWNMFIGGGLINAGTWLWNKFTTGLANIGTWLWNKFTTGLANIGTWAWDTFTGGLANLGTWVWDIFTGGLASIGTWVWDTLTGGLASIGTWVWDTLTGGLANFGTWLWDMFIGGGLANAGAWLWNKFTTGLANIGTWAWDTFTGGLANLGTWVWDIFTGGLANFGTWLWDMFIGGGLANAGTWLWDTFTSGLANIGTWLWDTITGAMAKLGEWILNIVPGLKDAIGTVSDIKGDNITKVNEQIAKTQKSRHASLNEKISQIEDPLDRKTELKRLIHTREERITGTKNTLKNESMASYLNPFGYARENRKGLRNQLSSDQATVVDWKKQLSLLETSAEVLSQGKDPGSIYVHDIHVQEVMNNLLKAMTGQKSETGSLGLIEALTGGTGGMASNWLDIGMFNQFAATLKEANDSKANDSKAAIYNKFTKSQYGMDIGMFNQFAATLKEANDSKPSFFGDLSSNIVKGILGTTSSLIDVFNPMNWFGTSKVDQDKGDSVSAIENLTGGTGGMISELLSPMEGFGKAAVGLFKSLFGKEKGDASTNLLDYTDDMKRGHVSPLSLSPDQVEQRVMREKYGEKSHTIAGMDGIEFYLAQHSNMFETMIRLLDRIATKDVGSSSRIVGPSSGGSPLGEIPGIKALANDRGDRGHWDLTFGDHNDAVVTMGQRF